MRSIHAHNIRRDRCPGLLAPTAGELAIQAACQRARDARAAVARRRAAASKRFVIRVALPAWGLCAVVTFATIVGGM